MSIRDAFKRVNDTQLKGPPTTHYRYAGGVVNEHVTIVNLMEHDYPTEGFTLSTVYVFVYNDAWEIIGTSHRSFDKDEAAAMEHFHTLVAEEGLTEAPDLNTALNQALESKRTARWLGPAMSDVSEEDGEEDDLEEEDPEDDDGEEDEATPSPSLQSPPSSLPRSGTG